MLTKLCCTITEETSNIERAFGFCCEWHGSPPFFPSSNKKRKIGRLLYIPWSFYWFSCAYRTWFAKALDATAIIVNIKNINTHGNLNLFEYKGPRVKHLTKFVVNNLIWAVLTVNSLPICVLNLRPLRLVFATTVETGRFTTLSSTFNVWQYYIV